MGISEIEGGVLGWPVRDIVMSRWGDCDVLPLYGEIMTVVTHYSFSLTFYGRVG